VIQLRCALTLLAVVLMSGMARADLSVEQPTKFELVFNARTAKMLGQDIPLTLLGRADEVIE